jgi:hypothetical protein
MSDKCTFKIPSRTHTDSGGTRNVGFELEFTGLDLATTIAVVVRTFNGREHSRSAAHAEIEVEKMGVFNVELDWNFLKQKAIASDRDGDEEWLELLSQAAALLVPMEVVCPPVRIDAMDKLDNLVTHLRDAGAVGTEDSLIAAYGVHINAETPSLGLDTIRAYVEAFGLLQWWLVDEHQVDLARRVSPYIDLYPETYLKELFATRYTDMHAFIDGYLKHNASRNRALDMLPLLAHIDPEAVNHGVSDAKIKSRPTFHYRLPNCQIDKPGWSLAQSWNTWSVVEELANQPEELQRLKDKFLAMSRPIFGVSRGDWTRIIRTWARNNNLQNQNQI